MRFSPLSFVLGLAAASLVPVLSRVFRPLAVEATAAGMGMLEDARRIFAEQMENLEDVVAEAYARREHLDVGAQPGVQACTWSPRTRSLLVVYRPVSVTAAGILETVAHHTSLIVALDGE